MTNYQLVNIKHSPPRHSVWTVPTGGGAPFTDVRGGKQLSTLQIKEERETIANVTSAGEQLGQGGWWWWSRSAHPTHPWLACHPPHPRNRPQESSKWHQQVPSEPQDIWNLTFHNCSAEKNKDFTDNIKSDFNLEDLNFDPAAIIGEGTGDWGVSESSSIWVT